VKKIIVILAVCLALLVAALGCGGGKGTHKMDMKIGVSALVALTDNHIESYMNAMEPLAMTEEVRSGDWDEMVAILAEVQETQVEGIEWYVLPDGSYYTIALGKTDKNLSDRPYFPGLMAGNKVLGDLLFSKATGKKSIMAAVPVKREGEVVAGLGVSIFLDDLSTTLAEELQLPANMVFYATNEEGIVALHSDTELIFTENPDVPKDAVFETSPLTGWSFALGFKD
jgi:hypothetical protein